MSAAPKVLIACKSPTPVCLGRLIPMGPGNEIVSPMATSLAKRPAFTAAGKPGRRNHVVVRAQQAPALDVTRRAALASLATAAGLSVLAPRAEAAYGDPANVFGRTTNPAGFIPFVGDGYALDLPSKWNPSKEKEFAGTVLRYEDNFDQANHCAVVVTETSKESISAFGSPDAFLPNVTYLLGVQSFSGETQSEGGFASGRVAAASILDVTSTTDKKGKEYYEIHILTRTADGDEGGKHHLIKSTVSGGKLWTLAIQVGDKRWFKGVKKQAEGLVKSFVVA